MSLAVACFGGATVDLTFAHAGQVLLGREIHASSRRAFGGVARNVAANLAALGIAVALFSAVGDDDDGLALIADAQALGIDTLGIVRIDGEHTARYVAVVDGGGEIAFAAADTAIFEHLAAIDLNAVRSVVGHGAWLFVEANVRASAITSILSQRKGGAFRVALDPGSVPCVAKMPASLDGVDVVFMNEAEAAAYFDVRSISAVDAARQLIARGAGSAVVTRGARGCVVADTTLVEIPAAPAAPVDMTGAGDALIGGTLAGLARGQALADAARTGTILAARTIETIGSVRRVSIR